LPCGRTECVPPIKSPIPGLSPQGFSPRLAPRGGAGSARPKGWHGLDRDISALGPWPFAYAPGGNEMPGHPEGRTTRTHRVRPSEKIAYPRTSPRQAISPGSLHPAEGRAPHARREGITPTLPHFRHRPLANSWVAITCPGLRRARICGRGDRAPPREPPSAYPGSFPARLSQLGSRIPRRGGLRTPG
jgi:hypothetical protein